MQASTLPARRGWSWLVEGFSIFCRKPVPLCFLALGYWLVMAVVSAIPWIGWIVGILLIPVFSVSLMNASRRVDQKEELPPQVLFSGFHRNLQTLIVLGLIYLLAMLAILGASALFDGGLLLRMFMTGKAPADDLLERMTVSARVFAVLLIPVVLSFWFAPMLSAWRDMSAGKSLFFSLVACLRNWRAFLTYGFSVVLLCIFVPRLIFALTGTSEISLVALIFVSLVLSPPLYASFYVSYRDIFSVRDIA